jgi:hypothetical protein
MPDAYAYITGTVDQELLVRNEYLAAENRILKAQIKGRLLLSKSFCSPYRGRGERQSEEARRGCKPRLFNPFDLFDHTATENRPGLGELPVKPATQTNAIEQPSPRNYWLSSAELKNRGFATAFS